MTREEFIEILEEKGYSYEEKRGKLVVTEGGVFGNIDLRPLVALPPGLIFDNYGFVNLHELETLSPGVEFNNGGAIYLASLQTIPPDVVFRNGGDVNLNSLIGSWFSVWKGNITRIAPNRILNKMIADGLFDRRR